MDNLINFIQASLLHHIEIFRERFDGSNVSELKWEPKISPQEEKIIKTACSLARGKGGKEVPEEVEIHPGLEPIFKRVFSPEKEKRGGPYYQVSKITPSYPTLQNEEPEEEGYEALWKEFAEEFNQQVADNLHPENLLLILEKYTSLLPFEAANPDVSLFHHLKMTTAIASCLYLSREVEGRPEKPYLLVVGDFSGVQDFVYTITSKGALKTLKARSFFLELLAEHIICEILTPLRLSRANIISSGGGKFFLLLPNTEEVRGTLEEGDRLKSIKDRINKYLKDEHEARLYFVLARSEFSREVFLNTDGPKEELTKLWRTMGGEVWKEKNQKFKDALKSLLKVAKVGGRGKVVECQICHKEIEQNSVSTIDKDISVCRFCDSLYRLGGKLFEAKFILREKNKPHNSLAIKIEDVYYTLREAIDDHTAGPQWAINSWELANYKKENIHPLFIGNYQIPDYTFQDYARDAGGSKRIAALRMDVDSLGDIFSRGFGAQQSLLRTSILSAQLNLFFRYYLNHICKGKKVAIIYAGGDDLFIVGAWDHIIELGFDIHNAFDKYTRGRLTLSGGFIVIPHNFPLYQMAQLAGKAERKAKENEEDGKKKDSFTFFYNPNPEKIRGEKERMKLSFKWEKGGREIKQLKEGMATLLGEWKGDYLDIKVPHAFIYNLLTITDYWRREGKLYLPRLAGVLKRVETDLKRGWASDWDNKKKREWEELKLKLMKWETITYLYPVLMWIELLTRKEE